MVETPNNRNHLPKLSGKLRTSFILPVISQKQRLKEHFPGKISVSQYKSQCLTDRFLYIYTSPTRCSFAVLLNSPAAPLHRGGKYTLAPLRNAWTSKGPRPPNATFPQGTMMVNYSLIRPAISWWFYLCFTWLFRADIPHVQTHPSVASHI